MPRELYIYNGQNFINVTEQIRIDLENIAEDNEGIIKAIRKYFKGQEEKQTKLDQEVN